MYAHSFRFIDSAISGLRALVEKTQ